MAGNPRGRTAREAGAPDQGITASSEPCLPPTNGSRNLLEAARGGWGVTVRYCVLVVVIRWPVLIGGTGALTLATSYARARGWI